ncbi:MAG: hypothetical protein K2N63_15520 [Lachnospiraceae bacterium]|nr:hypothetical protein [Lachnospiraceae bacterium]
MNRKIIISVNSDCSELFEDFANVSENEMTLVSHKQFIGGQELVDFIVELTPHLITALTTYLVTRVKNSKKEIKIKKGDLEIELKNTDLTPDDTLSLLEKLEHKSRKK